jgi:hypothetical protein
MHDDMQCTVYECSTSPRPNSAEQRTTASSLTQSSSWTTAQTVGLDKTCTPEQPNWRKGPGRETEAKKTVSDRHSSVTLKFWSRLQNVTSQEIIIQYDSLNLALLIVRLLRRLVPGPESIVHNFWCVYWFHDFLLGYVDLIEPIKLL